LFGSLVGLGVTPENTLDPHPVYEYVCPFTSTVPTWGVAGLIGEVMAIVVDVELPALKLEANVSGPVP
jgi:hypothetical protein